MNGFGVSLTNANCNEIKALKLDSSIIIIFFFNVVIHYHLYCHIGLQMQNAGWLFINFVTLFYNVCMGLHQLVVAPLPTRKI